MSSSTPNGPRFLLDENVRIELFKFLDSKGFDVKTLPKGVPDSFFIKASKREKRILVTNDKDFSRYTEEEIFSLILLKIPQKDVNALVTQFEKLFQEHRVFEKKFIALYSDEWEITPLNR